MSVAASALVLKSVQLFLLRESSWLRLATQPTGSLLEMKHFRLHPRRTESPRDSQAHWSVRSTEPKRKEQGRTKHTNNPVTPSGGQITIQHTAQTYRVAQTEHRAGGCHPCQAHRDLSVLNARASARAPCYRPATSGTFLSAKQCHLHI